MPSLLLSAALALVLVAPATLAAGRDLAPRPFGPSAYSPQAPLVAHAGGKYLTVWLESLDRAGWRYLGAFSDSAGKRLSPTAFVVIPYGIAGPGQLGTGESFTLFFVDGVGDVAWDGGTFVLALRERDLLTVRRLDANLWDAAPARIANIAGADTDDSAPSVAVAISGNTIIGLQECNADGGRAVVHAEQELAEPRRRRTVRR